MVYLTTLVFVCAPILGCARPTGPSRDVGTPVTLHRLPIPAKETGYEDLDSQIISTRQELDALLLSIRDQENWNDKEDFVNTLLDADLNFHADILVLVRHTEGSSTPRVWLEPPMMVDSANELILRIGRDVPQAVTRDMTFYGYAIVVPRSLARNIIITGATANARYVANSTGKSTLRPFDSRDIHLSIDPNGIVTTDSNATEQRDARERE